MYTLSTNTLRYRGRGSIASKITVKKEPPSSPEMPSSRHRPRRLDLSTSFTPAQSALTGRPSGSLTAKDSATIHDVGLACLSPGLHTLDPNMREQLQRSIDVRDRQRQIIEARQKSGKDDTGDGQSKGNVEPSPFAANGSRTPARPGRKRPPPGLSIAPPSHQQFANERVIQSAPLHPSSFPGLRPNLQPMSRQLENKPSSLSGTSHIHHVPATQTNNRLPPISDVFAGEGLGHPRESVSGRNLSVNYSPGDVTRSAGGLTAHQGPVPSPGFPPPTASARPSLAQQPKAHSTQALSGNSGLREYKSAEEAVHSLAGGREELLPRIVHYGGHQPPTPPSPMIKSGYAQHHHQAAYANAEAHRGSTSGRRRGREEYERDSDVSPLQASSHAEGRKGPFGAGSDSPENVRRKKEEFITLCERAWDLFHS